MTQSAPRTTPWIETNDLDGASRDGRGGWDLQLSQLPDRLPDLPGIALAARYVSAGTSAGAGGDWYDVIPLPEGRVGLAIGDVAGRGRHAATSMATLRNALRAYALEDAPPAATVGKLERFVSALEPGEITTVLYAVLDRDRGTVVFASAGHPAPLLVPAVGEASFAPQAASAPVGSGAGPVRADTEIELPPGTTFVLYSNGLIGRRGERPTHARERLRQIAAGGRREPEPLVIRLVSEAIDGRVLADDAAVLAARVEPRTGETLRLVVPAAAEELAEVRWALRRWLTGRGASVREVAAITLACQEACANAVEHAYGLPDAAFELAARHSGDRVEIVISDRGRWRPPRGDHRGRGLTIMRSVMDEVDVVAGDGGTTVRLAHRLQAAA